MRVYEFAKELDMSSKELMSFAESIGIDYKSHMNAMEDEEMEQVLDALTSKEDENNEEHEETAEVTSSSEEGSSGAEEREESEVSNEVNEETEMQEVAATEEQEASEENTSDDRNILEYTEGMTITDIAEEIDEDPADLVKTLFMMGVAANQNQSLDSDTIEILADEYGYAVEEKVETSETDSADSAAFFETYRDDAELEARPPVVTIMGHVDHGKTTLLDTLRDEHVTEGEAGGITQHIGAYQVVHDGTTITFLDTPGHSAFTTMRARGADVTDIAIIVVAADDGVMPQTEEAINHAKAADVPIIVAVNKVDKPNSNPDRVKQELTEYGLIPEEWGGDTIFVEISALLGQNLDELLEMITLIAEVSELKASPEGRPLGSVIEARLDKSSGATATVLVQEGTLRIGDPIVVGNTYGRVRTMLDDHGQRIEEAGPSTPVEITGLNRAPEAGDHFVVFKDEKKARQVGQERAEKQLMQDRESNTPVTLENLFDTIQEGEIKEVNVILKADVRGSIEALSSSFEKIDVEGVRVNVIHTGVGAINESDISLATASQALVIGFNVRPNATAVDLAEKEGVSIRTYNVIYNAIDEVESAMKGMLDPEYEEVVTGLVQVRETYNVSNIGTIAGGYVARGTIKRNSGVRLIRNGVVIYEGELASLRRFNDDVSEVTTGFECGLTLEDYNDVKVDDEIEAFEMVEVPII